MRSKDAKEYMVSKRVVRVGIFVKKIGLLSKRIKGQIESR